MKKHITVLAVALFIVAAILHAEEPKSNISKMKEKLSRFKTSSDVKVTTAVGGIRGAENKSSEELYWAGKESVTIEEMEMFKSALDKAEKGEKEQAKAEFEKFLSKYPKSALAKDAYAMIKTLK